MGEEGKPQEKEGSTYSSAFVFIYLFNLHIGIGLLALPKAFSEAGMVLGSILLIILAFVGYMTATYMIEAMAAANAYVKLEQREKKESSENESSSDAQKVNQSSSDRKPLIETTPLMLSPLHGRDQNIANIQAEDEVSSPDDYKIEKKFEMGTMANMFYHPIGIVLYYICICLYLYGDLAIFTVAIPKSFRTAVCKTVSGIANMTGNVTINMTDLLNSSNISSNFTEDMIDLSSFADLSNMTEPSNGTMEYFCFGHVTKTEAYYIFLSITVVLLCPWTFFNLTSSKYLQIVSAILRNIAIALMVIIALVQLGQGHVANPLPPAATFTGFPVLFGVSIYGFMCQHSLPGLITPIKSKKNILILIATEFMLSLILYHSVAFTGAYRFSLKELHALYTINFFTVSTVSAAETALTVIGYYLVLYPVFTLSTNFPVVSITLRENLKGLARFVGRRWIKDKPFPWLIDRILFPILAITPPIIIAYATEDIEVLVSITGSFPGIGVQYVIPATLVLAGRYAIKRKFGKYDNAHKSPFGHTALFIGIFIWTVVSIILIIADDVLNIVKNKFSY